MLQGLFALTGLSKAPLYADDENRRDDDPALHPKVVGKVVLNRVIDIRGKADPGDFLEIVIRPVITAVFKCIKKEFTRVAVDAFKNPSRIPGGPVSSQSHCNTAVAEAIVHRAKQGAIFGILREFSLHRHKFVIEKFVILPVVTRQVVDERASIKRI